MFPAVVRIDTPVELEYYRHGGILDGLAEPGSAVNNRCVVRVDFHLRLPRGVRSFIERSHCLSRSFNRDAEGAAESDRPQGESLAGRPRRRRESTAEKASSCTSTLAAGVAERRCTDGKLFPANSSGSRLNQSTLRTVNKLPISEHFRVKYPDPQVPIHADSGQ